MKSSVTQSHSYDRNKLTFVVGTAIIATVFLISIVGILTGKFRPFASEGTNEPVTTLGAKSKTVTFSNSKVDYTDGLGNAGTDESSGFALTVRPMPAAAFTLQAVPQNARKDITITGAVKIKKPNGEAIAEQEWVSNKEITPGSQQKARFDNDTLLSNLDNVTAPYSLTVAIKPKYYLAAQTTTTDYDALTIFNGEMKAGDFVEDNIVNIHDVSKWASDLGEPVTDGNRYKDVNRDGKIDIHDISAFAANLEQSGAQF